MGVQKKRVDGVFPGRPQSFRHRRRPVNNCSPGRGGMAQNGGTSGGTFHGKLDRCRGSQGWTTACSRMPERDGKNQGEDSPKQAGSFVLVRSPSLTSHKWLVSSGRLVCRCHDVFLWCYLCFDEAAALRSIVLRYAGAPIVTRFPLVYLEMPLFPRIFCTITAFSLYGEYVVRSFLPGGVFLPCVTAGWIFYIISL